MRDTVTRNGVIVVRGQREINILVVKGERFLRKRDRGPRTTRTSGGQGPRQQQHSGLNIPETTTRSFSDTEKGVSSEKWGWNLNYRS